MGRLVILGFVVLAAVIFFLTRPGERPDAAAPAAEPQRADTNGAAPGAQDAEPEEGGEKAAVSRWNPRRPTRARLRFRATAAATSSAAAAAEAAAAPALSPPPPSIVEELNVNCA